MESFLRRLNPNYFLQFMGDLNPEDRRRALEMNKKLLEFCDELWVFGNETTEGMREEIEYFKEIGEKIGLDSSNFEMREMP